MQRLYFVVETKSSLFPDDLRDRESAKIKCGKAHVKALAEQENPAQYLVARTVGDDQIYGFSYPPGRRFGGPFAQTTSRYPTAVSVSRCLGCAGSSSSFWRRCPM